MKISRSATRSDRLIFEILNEQRKALLELNKDPKIDEEIIRTFLYHIDLEEQRWQEYKEH